MELKRIANTDSADSNPRPRQAGVIVASTALLALVGLGYAAAAAALAGEVLPGTYVAGVDIGGFSPAEAEATLSKQVADVATKPLTVEIGKKRVQLSPGKIGLSVDVPATVAAAGAGWPSPVGVIRSFFGSRDLSLQIKVNEERLKAGVAALAKNVDRPTGEGRVVYQGLEPRVVLPASGQTLNQAETMKVLRSAYLRPGSPLRLPIAVVQPKVSEAAVRRVAATTARIAVAAPLTLTNGSRKATLRPEAIAGGPLPVWSNPRPSERV
ncbi:peptidoglycan binding domain-containing protein [Thermostaphylospora chromogena]|uniref:YoaR-like putative peptidoglycan binding domain-containing protein n=1 Tax=Thermostaphylospora chromogena TaxID=35622 RepID=A0A1H1C1V9_9ACTN|nr:peptidoglycan binding domain-containing protein [Thermostaphylospora chromogena]SDQ58131.1 hypothetical protein SAMN04489764_1250 [Thermostaphylospora chromogena]